MESKLISLSTLDKLPNDTIGQDILRYIALPDMLGPEKETLLYFIGKQIARKFEIDKMEDIIYFFYTLRWGKLELVKEKKKYLLFHLMSDDIVERIKSTYDVDFRLEAGFIAETIYQIKERLCNSIDSTYECLYMAEFKVHYIT